MNLDPLSCGPRVVRISKDGATLSNNGVSLENVTRLITNTGDNLKLSGAAMELIQKFQPHFVSSTSIDSASHDNHLPSESFRSQTLSSWEKNVQPLTSAEKTIKPPVLPLDKPAQLTGLFKPISSSSTKTLEEKILEKEENSVPRAKLVTPSNATRKKAPVPLNNNFFKTVNSNPSTVSNSLALEDKILSKEDDPGQSLGDLMAISQFSNTQVEDPNLSESSEEEQTDTTLDEFIQARIDEEVGFAIKSDKQPNESIRPKKPCFLPPVKKRKLDEPKAGKPDKAENVSKKKLDFTDAEKKGNLENKLGLAAGKAEVKDDFKILTEGNLSEVKNMLKGCKELSFLLVFKEGFTQFRDMSTIGTSFGSPRHVIVRIVLEDGTTDYIKIELWASSSASKVRAFFWDEFLVNSTARKIVFDGKAFLGCVQAIFPHSNNAPPSLRVIDPIVGCWLLRPDHPVSTFSGVISQIIPGSAVKSSGHDKASDIREEMKLLSTLSRELFRKLEERNLWSLFYQLEMRILPALVTMERVGVLVDTEKLKTIGEELKRKIKEVQRKAEKEAGKPFNLSSPKQVREVLYDELKLDEKSGLSVGKTAGGVKSTCESVLMKMTKCHPLPSLILQHRQVAKIKTTFVDGLLSHVSGGRISTSWDQVAAATGRVTSVSPNIQAIPKGEVDIGEGRCVNIRDAFIPPTNCVFLAADFEQIEFRIFGHLSQEPAIASAIREGGDMFRKLAAIWLDKKLDDVTGEDRDKTKRVVYALMYGAGKMRLSEILEISVPQAGVIINSFYTKFSSLKIFHQKVISMAEDKGYLTSLMGRRRYFPHISSLNHKFKAQAQRQAFNFLIQGSAADIAKTALIRAQEALSVAGVDSELVMMIHDEMVWQVRAGMEDTAAEVVRACLQDCGQVISADGTRRSLDMKVKISVGPTWGSMVMNK